MLCPKLSFARTWRPDFCCGSNEINAKIDDNGCGQAQFRIVWGDSNNFRQGDPQ